MPRRLAAAALGLSLGFGTIDAVAVEAPSTSIQATKAARSDGGTLNWRRHRPSPQEAVPESSAATPASRTETAQRSAVVPTAGTYAPGERSVVKRASDVSGDARTPLVLNAAQTTRLGAPSATQRSVVSRSGQPGRVAQLDSKQQPANDVDDILKQLDRPPTERPKLDDAPPADLPLPGAKPKAEEMPAKPKEKTPVDDALRDILNGDRSKAKPDDKEMPKDVPGKVEEPKPIPKAEEPQPKFETPRDDRGETPEQRCAREEQERQRSLEGKLDDRGHRQKGDIEYCTEALQELMKQRVTEISVDISPPQPQGDEAPQCDRDWHDASGKVLFRGRPWYFNSVRHIATFRLTNGEMRDIPLRQLSKIEQGHFLIMYGLPVECELEDSVFKQRAWACSTFTWTAVATCHKPAYFEQEHVERYGHSFGPFLQPVVSAGHFFATIPVLPYKMGLEPPSECIYSLGYYRPGSCAPYMIDPVPWSLRAATVQAGATVGGILWIP